MKEGSSSVKLYYVIKTILCMTVSSNSSLISSEQIYEYSLLKIIPFLAKILFSLDESFIYFS